MDEPYIHILRKIQELLFLIPTGFQALIGIVRLTKDTLQTIFCHYTSKHKRVQQQTGRKH